MLHNPSLLILDEPTADLDPMIREVIWRNIFKSKDRGVLFTTHLWEEASKYATKIYFIYEGKIISKALSSKELVNESVYQQKIIISKELISADHFDNEKNVLVISDDKFLKIYLKKEDTTTLQRVQEQTFNFSLMPVELEDIYQILTNSAK